MFDGVSSKTERQVALEMAIDVAKAFVMARREAYVSDDVILVTARRFERFLSYEKEE